MRLAPADLQRSATYVSAVVAWATFAFMVAAPRRENPDDWAYVRPEGGYSIALSPLVLAFATAAFFLAAYASPVAKLAVGASVAALLS